ncbi:dynein light chain roadblock-type 2 [Drosophila pseudoobscura]|uniref:Dynein light chain roadblock-type 2 n=1 Tax=Drosophila pseudoobscura pseudoobscura TaxID=46245 RepID=A0A6I8W6C8_DROPS|nr:dynein light chain roadblock-type 2 [Drosophila pseudoobscura]
MNKSNFKKLVAVVQSNSENTARISEQTSGYVVSENGSDTVMQTSFDNSTAVGIVKHLNSSFVKLAQSSVRDLDPTDKLCFLRVVTRKFEYMVAPEDSFVVTVVL